MKAAVLFELNKPLRVIDLPVPEPGACQVLVKMAYSGICHTQLLEIAGKNTAGPMNPNLLGHEGSGIVQKVGDGVKKVKEGDHVILSITDDGKGMRPDAIRNKAIEKGIITKEAASNLSDEQSLELIMLPGFSTSEQVSSVSGRGVGMDVVKTNIQKLNGTIGIISVPGKGSEFTISLPLTLAILPVLLLRLGSQTFAVPLSMVREILSITPEELQQISGKATMVVRGEVLPVLSLSALISWEQPQPPTVGVLMQLGANSFILAVDGFVGHDDVVIKSLDTFRPKGVAGATMSSEGDIVLILDVKELLSELRA